MSAATTPKVGDTWYRYEDVRYGVANEFGDVVSSYVQLRLTEFTVKKVTPKGVWVSAGSICAPRFVLVAANKRYALPTKQDALASLLARKARQIRILESNVKHAREASFLAERELAKLKPATDPIPVEHEEMEKVADWGLGLEHAVEQCVFCTAGTRYWHKASNTPVCPSCASTKNVSDLPTAVPAECPAT
jgi:hypothetical protein